MDNLSTMLELDEDLNIDLIEEIRLRTWARENYRSPDNRDGSWHPIVLDEMNRVDRDQ